MNFLFKSKLLIALFFILQSTFLAKAFEPQIQLSNIYHSGIDLDQYLVSEKLDGVRAYWDGKNLLSKKGNVFSAPKWFINNFPPENLEGELWIGRKKFEEVSGIVRTKIPNDSDWKDIHLLLFDMPKHKGTFKERLARMQILAQKSDSEYLSVIRQEKIKDEKSLMQLLKKVEKKGGEGLMLRRKDSLYMATRNDDLLKLKSSFDAEAKVLKHYSGKGKYHKMMGSILVENEEGVRFKIGGGFSDKMRRRPPKIGSVITYKYYGKTKNNKPRFASFLRVRENYDFKSPQKIP